MDRDDLVAEGLESVLNLLFVVVVRARYLGVRHEEDVGLLTFEEFFVLLAREVEVARIVVARARLDEDAALRGDLLRRNRGLGLRERALRHRASGNTRRNGGLEEMTTRKCHGLTPFGVPPSDKLVLKLRRTDSRPS